MIWLNCQVNNVIMNLTFAHKFQWIPIHFLRIILIIKLKALCQHLIVEFLFRVKLIKYKKKNQDNTYNAESQQKGMSSPKNT